MKPYKAETSVDASASPIKETFELPRYLNEKLMQEVAESGETKAAIIRLALDYYFMSKDRIPRNGSIQFFDREDRPVGEKVVPKVYFRYLKPEEIDSKKE